MHAEAVRQAVAQEAQVLQAPRRILGTVTGLDYGAAGALLERSGWNVKAAILMHQLGLTSAKARSRLRAEPRLRKLLGGR